jgi:N-hydroxyarylamine O-acetyltransferase
VRSILDHDVDPSLADVYLTRLGFDERLAPTPEALDALHRAHLHRVPFENLDLHTGHGITLDVDRFVHKVAVDRRGGFCYELNGAFAWLLATLGFEVELLEGRVHGADGPVMPFDHLCLRVAGAAPMLADVGFGDCFDGPVPLRLDEVHRDTNGIFALTAVDEGWIDLVRGEKPVYRLSTDARSLEDFAPGCAFHQTAASHFMKSTVCSLRTDTGRVTLSELLLVRRVAGTRTESPIEPDEIDTILRDEFDVVLSPEDLDRLRKVSGTTRD